MLPFRLSFPSTLPHILFWDQAAHPLAGCISTSRQLFLYFSSTLRVRHRPEDEGGQDEEHKLLLYSQKLSLHHVLTRALPSLRACAGTCYRLPNTTGTQRVSRQAPHYSQHLRRHQRASTNSKGYCHEKPSKEEHEDKVSRPSTEGAFF